MDSLSLSLYIGSAVGYHERGSCKCACVYVVSRCVFEAPIFSLVFCFFLFFFAVMFRPDFPRDPKHKQKESLRRYSKTILALVFHGTQTSQLAQPRIGAPYLSHHPLIQPWLHQLHTQLDLMQEEGNSVFLPLQS